MTRTRKLGAVIGAAGLLTVASVGGAVAQDPTPVSVQLQWAPQAQFAGYFAAKSLGFWDELGLDVTLVDGGPNVVPQVVGSDPNGPEFTISWVPKVLEVRDAGQSDLVDIAQIFQRSGTLSVSWADAPVNTPADFAGKKIGGWGFGNEYEVTAAASEAGLVKDQDYELVNQDFNMSLLLNREIDAAEAMIYNEYAQVLETTNPATGELYQPEDLVKIDYNDVGTAMLQDAIYSRADWLAQEGNEEIATKFLAGAFKGWAFCRDNPEQCVQFTVDAGSTLGLGHQNWMMNEVEALVWPSPDGIGAVPQDTWDKTVDISTTAGIISKPPDEGAVRSDLADAARAMLTDVDLTGDGFTKGTVEVTAGGE